MSSSNLASIREELERHFGRIVAVEPDREYYRVTLPGTTYDGHLVTVYLRPLFQGYWEVQDAGTTAADLFCHGLRLDARRRTKLLRIADQLGIRLDQDDAFKATCAEQDLPFYVWRVRDAVALASGLLPGHRTARTRAGLRQRIRQTLSTMSGRGFHVRERATVAGRLATHRLDFEVRPSADSIAAAIQVLSPSGGAWLRAEAYAFMVGDLDGRYRHLAVLEEPEHWTGKAIGLVERVAARVIYAQAPELMAEELSQVVEGALES